MLIAHIFKYGQTRTHHPNICPEGTIEKWVCAACKIMGAMNPILSRSGRVNLLAFIPTDKSVG